MFDLENVAVDSLFLAGCDEVGRGPLAGPVVAACVYIELNEDFRSLLECLYSFGVTDSKKLSAKKRRIILGHLGIEYSDQSGLVHQTQFLCPISDKNLSLRFSIVEISPRVIDEINILNASLKAMGDSFSLCHNTENFGDLLIDGNQLLRVGLPGVEQKSIIKGDSKSVIIGLASIIAKEYRDQLMVDYSKEYPGYGLDKHSGYPTKAHKEAIEKNGITAIHRKSFKGVKEFVQRQ